MARTKPSASREKMERARLTLLHEPVGINTGLLTVILALLAIGCVAIYSATIAQGDNPRSDFSAYHFIVRHVIFVLAGGFAAWVVYRIPLGFWERVAPWLLILAVFLLAAVLVPGVGRRINGATRWIPLGPVQIQVCEIVKLAVLLGTASFTVRRQDFMHSTTKGFLPMALYMAVVAVLVMQQPDLGSLVVIVAIFLGTLFIGGLSLYIFAAVLTVVILVVGWIVWDTPWRMSRVLAFMEPWSEEHVLNTAYQLSHSLIAFGRGELFGVGLGGSVEKLAYLPEPHTDFIMAVWAEETGFAGVLVGLFLFYWLIRHAFEIGRQAIKLERYFAGLLAQGIGIWFGVQVFINIGVASGALPTKGLTLPFVSYGGSAVVTSLLAMGLLMRVDFENRIHMRGGQV